MARDISIVISAKDNFTDAIKKMQTSQTTFRKDLGQLNTELGKLNNNKVSLKVDLTQAKNDLKDAEKAFKKLGDEANKSKLIMAQTNYDNTKRNFDLVSQGAKNAERDIKNLTGAMSKADNRANTSANSGAFSVLAKAGLFNMVGSAASNALGTGVTSMFGSSTGSMFGTIAGGAASGAAIGSIIPGIGTAVGAAVGTVAGAINAGVQKFNEVDDSFKSTVSDYYNTVKTQQTTSLTSGSNIAQNREKMQISFATLLGGSGNAKSFLNDLTAFATKTPFQYDQLTTMSRTALAYGYKQNQILPLLTNVGNTGSALGMNADDMNVVVQMLGRMNTTGKTTLEYLNPLLERGIPVFDYLSKATGKSKKDVQEGITKGLLKGADAAKIISDYMGKAYNGQMDKMSSTFEGLMSNYQDLKDQLDKSMGEGYNEERKKGLQKNIDFLSGDSGKKMQDANKMIGAWKASLENQHDDIVNKTMTNAMNSDAYKKALNTNDRVKMGQLLAEAQVKGENDWKASEGYKQQVQADLDLVTAIQKDTATNQSYYNTGYLLGQQMSKGLIAALSGTSVKATTDGTKLIFGGGLGGNAYGKDRVPYDNYPTLLHEGERVLTASQARQADNGTSNPTINIAQLHVREEADVTKIAKQLVKELEFYRTGYAM